MKKLLLELELDWEVLAEQIAFNTTVTPGSCQETYKDIIEFVISLDGYMADQMFTDMLKKAIKRL